MPDVIGINSVHFARQIAATRRLTERAFSQAIGERTGAIVLMPDRVDLAAQSES